MRDFPRCLIRACVNVYKLDPNIRDLNISETPDIREIFSDPVVRDIREFVLSNSVMS